MRTHNKIGVVVSAALVAAALMPAPASSQLAQASASSLALSGNNTATVRAFGAISVNPAGLAMPGSGFSLAIAPVRGRAGLGPVTLSDLADWQGVVVPDATKEEWLTAVEAAGGQSGSTSLGVSLFALTVGHVGLQVSTLASADLNIPAGVAEAVLFGNAGRTGTATDLDLSNLFVQSFAASTAALSVGFPVGAAKLGVTGKYTVGHALALANGGEGSFSSDPLELDLGLPMLTPCDDEILGQCTSDFANAGSGFGVDLGFMMDLPALTIGASIQNAFNTFAWDETRLAFRPGLALAEQGVSEADFDETAYESAPDELKAMVEDMTFKPTLRVGAAMDLPMAFTVSADIHKKLGEGGLATGPDSHIGVGAEFRGLGFLHLRAGTAVITGGTQISGGASLVLGPVNLSAAAAKQQGDGLADGALVQLVLSFGNR